MKNIWIKAVAFCVISLAVASCSRSFEEINTDTSKIIEPTPASLLAPIQYNMASNAYLRANDFTFDRVKLVTHAVAQTFQTDKKQKTRDTYLP